MTEEGIPLDAAFQLDGESQAISTRLSRCCRNRFTRHRCFRYKAGHGFVSA
jgi:hypothetical protein